LIPIKDLGDSTVGIIGYGEIGYEIAKRCKGLGMKVIGCRRNPKKRKDENDPADIVVGMDQVDKVLGRSDFLVLALPSTKETRYFLNKQRLKQMKKGSYLINVGRGNTIEEKHLVECLNSNHIAGAALDVFDVEPLPKDHPFWTLDNVIVSPHNAYYSPKNVERNMNLFITNLKLFIEGKPMLNVVDKKLGY
jgi:phosphoglycerate dehydrogenase-like enzyme